MAKNKTHKGTKKRIKVTATGKLMRRRAFGSHLLTKKSANRKRKLRKAASRRVARHQPASRAFWAARRTEPCPESREASTPRRSAARRSDEAKGYWGLKKSSYRRAKEQLIKSGTYAYRDRRARKREFRRLWITRINAGAREHGLSYNQLIHGLKVAEIEVDRKILADLAVREPEVFAQMAARAKQALGAQASSGSPPARWRTRPSREADQRGAHVIRDIAGRQNHSVKLARKLQKKKYRRERGLLVGEGMDLLVAACAAGARVREILVRRELLQRAAGGPR